MGAVKQRTLIQSSASTAAASSSSSSAAAAAATAAAAAAASTAVTSGAGRLAGSIDFVDIPLNDNTFFNWSSSPLSEKRSSL